MSAEDHKKQLFRDLGFRCFNPTSATLLDGSEVLIQANIHEGKVPDWSAVQQAAPNLRNYTLTDKDGRVELIEEPDLEARLGAESFRKLPV